MTESTTFKVGSRKSQLALIQTNEVIDKLRKLYPDKKFEIVEMTTVGDKILDKPLPKIGEKSLFTRELENALLTSEVDFVVHSLKDLPTILPDGLTVGAVMEREDPRDALIVQSKYDGKGLKTLPESSVIGTSSLRRTAQLARDYSHLEVQNIRGNLNTRLRKLDEDKLYDGIILAAAGVKRMKWEERIREYLDPNEFLYAVGQGAIAVECRTGDDAVMEILETLNHIPTILRVVCERSFLTTLGGGCSAPVGVHSTFSDNTLRIVGAVWSLDGSKMIRKDLVSNLKCGGSGDDNCDDDDGSPPRKCRSLESRPHVAISVRNAASEPMLIQAEELGQRLANEMIRLGALEIVNEAKTANEKGSALDRDNRVQTLENESSITNSIKNGDKR